MIFRVRFCFPLYQNLLLQQIGHLVQLVSEIWRALLNTDAYLTYRTFFIGPIHPSTFFFKPAFCPFIPSKNEEENVSLCVVLGLCGSVLFLVPYDGERVNTTTTYWPGKGRFPFGISFPLSRFHSLGNCARRIIYMCRSNMQKISGFSPQKYRPSLE